MGYQDGTYAVWNKSLSWQMGYRLLSFEAETASSGLLAGDGFALTQAHGVAKPHKAPPQHGSTMAPAPLRGQTDGGRRERHVWDQKFNQLRRRDKNKSINFKACSSQTRQSSNITLLVMLWLPLKSAVQTALLSTFHTLPSKKRKWGKWTWKKQLTDSSTCCQWIFND